MSVVERYLFEEKPLRTNAPLYQWKTIYQILICIHGTNRNNARREQLTNHVLPVRDKRWSSVSCAEKNFEVPLLKRVEGERNRNSQPCGVIRNA